ncbi:hypothetical protein BD410DRAFT_805051 [Rickenella mellea]|uniref:Uncharacterized protein n=1 Tax=Rickenella mellea TaxID=50990 RepID=A0A4Y7PYS4_9AGAM|nr:hypothetical protein BD410DRAFT_805051 [Rickenella mellea]
MPTSDNANTGAAVQRSSSADAVPCLFVTTKFISTVPPLRRPDAVMTAAIIITSKKILCTNSFGTIDKYRPTSPKHKFTFVIDITTSKNFFAPIASESLISQGV